MCILKNVSGLLTIKTEVLIMELKSTGKRPVLSFMGEKKTQILSTCKATWTTDENKIILL